ncbi:MAG: hypothetical protein WBB43_17920, partial [Limnoraphis sp.]
MADVVIVMVIMGIFAAIAAPTWDALVTRQRVRSINGQVLQALQIAQAEAKRKKQNYVVEFQEAADPTTDLPEFSVHLEGTPDADKFWEPLNLE